VLLRERGLLDTVMPDADDASEAMTAAIDRLLDRYPWLSDDVPADKDDHRPPPPPSTGRPGARKKRDSTRTTDAAALRLRFPALKKH
jgi:hypothetical protein